MQSLGILERKPVAVVIADEPALVVVAKVPSFRQFKRQLPDEGLMFSCILHCAALALLPMLAPALRVVVNPQREITLISPDEASAHLYLPALGDSGSQSGSSSNSGSEGVARRAKAGTPRRETIAKYEGPQAILSDPPDATNEQQTIRRPDMEAPMKIKAPVRLQSMVQIAAPKIKAPIAPPDFLAHPTPMMPQKAEVTVNAPAPVKEPVLVVRQSQAAPKVVDVPPPSVTPAKTAAPQLTEISGNAPVLAKSVVVINAVEPAPDATAIPDGEISGRFSVAPMNITVSGPPAAAASNGKLEAGARGGRDAGAGTGPVGSAGTGSGTAEHGGTGAGSSGAGSGAGLAGNGSGSHAGNGISDAGGTGTGAGPGSGAGAGSGVGNGDTGRGGVGNGGSMHGLSIAGGKGGGGGIGAGISPGHSYHLTIVAAGSNGGASRDLGIFSKDETVYTVSLSMKDSGGGPDWPMQYALFTTPKTRVALSPPYPVKQVEATLKEPFRDTSPVFITAELDETGQLRSLRAARASDTRAAAAIAVLAQWQFSPAKLDGKAVPA
jgi:hypothetical protein